MFIVNLSQDKSKVNPYLSNTLLKEIKESLDKNKKVILYLNKRWEYSSLICNKCNHLYKCENCDVSLNIHKYPEKLVCHICNNTKNVPTRCEKCGSDSLQKIWIWTQQIENSIKKEFVNYNIFRFDTDSVKNKTLKNNALNTLKKADIIIWTKMITTGFDFSNVGLIWVVLIEQELLIPKYNTEEQIYSNIKQLIWRWSRKWDISNIVIQTFIPQNEIIKDITESNYKDFFIKTLTERKLFWYPPFLEMATLEYRNKDKQKAIQFIQNLKNKLEIETQTLLNSWTIKNIELIIVPNSIKKHNQYYNRLIIKWEKIRILLEQIRTEILKNSSLVVIFE